MNRDNVYQNTPEWYGARLYHFTSSKLHKLMTSPKSKQDRKSGKLSKVAEDYIFDKLAEDLTGGTSIDYVALDTKEVRWGHAYEPEARARYEEHTGRQVDLCGFIEWSKAFGGSPDGLVGEDGMIEIKCPFNTANHARYLLLESSDELAKLEPEYYAQIQGNLLVTGRYWCDFISYDPRCQRGEFALKILRVPRDEVFIDRAREAIDRAERLRKQRRDKIIRLCMNMKNA